MSPDGLPQASLGDVARFVRNSNEIGEPGCHGSVADRPATSPPGVGVRTWGLHVRTPGTPGALDAAACIARVPTLS